MFLFSCSTVRMCAVPEIDSSLVVKIDDASHVAYAREIISAMDDNQLQQMREMSSIVQQINKKILRTAAGFIDKLPTADEMLQAKLDIVGMDANGLDKATTEWPFNQILPILHQVHNSMFEDY
eukprot:GEMP01068392.1.p1 GENE.GEMP01068392.1~~GEMP01068392.1.p1  ORF type:complete len:123 (+),score=19.23 GEMP01068392.1:112-480(+)